jgi:hypothetical protein
MASNPIEQEAPAVREWVSEIVLHKDDPLPPADLNRLLVEAGTRPSLGTFEVASDGR